MATTYTLPAVVYAGNNSTVTAYTIPFPFLEPEYVYAAVTTGGTTTELDPSEYTVTQDPDEQGGTLTTDVAVPGTSTITIFRRTDRIQPVEYPSAGAFPADSHERALDRLTHIVQELNNAILGLQGDAENIEVPTSGGEQDLEDTRYFATLGQLNSATPERVGQIAVVNFNRASYYGTATTVGAWNKIRERGTQVAISGSSPLDIPFDTYAMVTHNLTGDMTYGFSGLAAGTFLDVVIFGDGTNRTIAWPAGVNWENGVEPTSVAANEWLWVRFLAGGPAASNTYGYFVASDGSTSGTTLVYLTASTSSVAIGTGSKTFTVDTGLDYAPGDWVSMVSDADPTVDYMIGQVTSYSGSTLQVNVTVTGGSGTKTDWTINLSGRPGAAGAAGAAADNSILVLIEAPTAKSYTICQSATTAGTIQNLIAKLASGTCTLAVKINGVDVTGLAAVAVTSSESTTAATAANTVAVGDTITVVASSISSPADLSFVVEIA